MCGWSVCQHGLAIHSVSAPPFALSYAYPFCRMLFLLHACCLCSYSLHAGDLHVLTLASKVCRWCPAAPRTLSIHRSSVPADRSLLELRSRCFLRSLYRFVSCCSFLSRSTHYKTFAARCCLPSYFLCVFVICWCVRCWLENRWLACCSLCMPLVGVRVDVCETV